ncbi:MAG: hypothetical protein K2M69_08355 [Muribaculaceae bacterium]|nr:hypothetical protein [Muribaculaceae bacterium]
MKKIKKSVWLPAIITVYFIGMMCWFGPELIRTQQTSRFVTVAAIEIVVIVALYFFLKKREEIK